MSSEALSWAFRLDVKPSSVKFTLIAMCECANYRTGRITPSISHLEEITGQNRKTIIANIAALERLGLIADTGERTGRTGQIKVYRAEFGTVPKTEQYQKRNSTEKGVKQSQKRDTEPSLEPSSPSVATQPSVKRVRALTPSRPDEVDPQVWTDFIDLRKRKRAPLTDTALDGIRREAAKARWPLNDALTEAVTRGWQSFKAEWIKTDGTNIRSGVNGSPDRRNTFERAIAEGHEYLGN